jgi:hypothetical protein
MKLIEKIIPFCTSGRRLDNTVATGQDFAKKFHPKVIPIHVLQQDLLNKKEYHPNHY